MSTTSTLADLAKFVARSEGKPADPRGFWRAFRHVSETAHQRPGASRVADLLGVVMALSSRTQRSLAPKSVVELDVFAPDGKRAVRLSMQD